MADEKYRLKYSGEEIEAALDTLAGLDEILSSKVDKEAGKGLSTNDFTDVERAEIAGNSAGVAYLANSGAKNLLRPTMTAAQTKEGVTCTPNGDGTFTVSGDFPETSTAANTYFIIGNTASLQRITAEKVTISGASDSSAAGVSLLRFYQISGSGNTDITSGELTVDFTPGSNANVSIVVYRGQSFDNVIFKPMIRDSAISDSAFQPYIPSNAELYEMIRELQSGS